MIQKIAKVVERALEVNIVFPERIVGVDQKGEPLSMSPGSFPPCPFRGATCFTCSTRRWRIRNAGRNSASCRSRSASLRAESSACRKPKS